MVEHTQDGAQGRAAQAEFEVERLSRGDYLLQVTRGIAISLGLCLLWTMETGRNAFFRLLDRLHVKPRKHGRMVPFPPDGRHQRAHGS